MTDITNIKEYLEWRAQHEERKIDTSPEAWAWHLAVEHLADRAGFLAFEMQGGDKDLQSAVQEYNETKEALNAD